MPLLTPLAEYCLGLKESILNRQVLSPWILEQDFGLSEGNIFHDKLDLEQLLCFSPADGCAKYKTPLKNLWICDSGIHPSSGVIRCLW